MELEDVLLGKVSLDTGKLVCFYYAELAKKERSESRAETIVGCKGSQFEEQWRKGRRGRREQMVQLYTMVKCSISQRNQLAYVINIH